MEPGELEDGVATAATAATVDPAPGPQGQPGPGGPQGQPGPGGPQGVPGLQGIPGLSSGVEALADTVKALRDEVAEQNTLLASAKRTADANRRWIRALVPLALVGALLLAFVYLGAYEIRAKQDRQTRATCEKWQGEAHANVTETTTDLGRVIVRTAAAGYRLIGCERFTGDLGSVDPDAYKLAPVVPTPGR